MRCGRDAEIVIVAERFANQFLQFRLVKYLRPLLIAQRALGITDDGGVIGAAEGRRRWIRGLLVLGANRAAGRRRQQRQGERDRDWLA